MSRQFFVELLLPDMGGIRANLMDKVLKKTVKG